jgi:glycosyltransferase involved in cell wall biosynthesis
VIIGLILSSAPSYSETFFRNKIRLLEEAGNKVIVFADNSNDIETDYTLVSGFRWKGSFISKFKNVVCSLLDLLRSPFKAMRLFGFNKRDGFSARKNFLSLLSSAHILGFNLDWLHFGFATMALGRENLGQVLHARTAVSIRGFDIGIYPVKHPGCYELLWKKLDKLHYISDDLFSSAVTRGFDLNKRHQKITPAIDSMFFEGQQRFNFHSPIKILTVARLHWKKGLEYSLDALAILDQKGIDFRYTIIGEGEDYERLNFAAHQLGIKAKVIFAGKMSPQEVRKAYRENDIYLQYSIQEGFCNAVLEAQAMGLFVVVSNAEGLSENVLHKKTGWIVPKRNPLLLASQIIDILNLQPIERSQISLNAINRVKKNFNLEKQKLEFLDFYQ